MFFVSAVKDYLEVLSNITDNLTGTLSFDVILKSTLLYLATSTKVFVSYILSFEWFRNISYLPIIAPALSQEILRENYVLDTPLSNLFTFFDAPSYAENKFVLGLLNSFFLAIPISVAHLIAFRRFIIQGLLAGLTSALGIIVGQIGFIGAVLFGVRSLVIPWFATEPLSYIIGIFLILTIIYDMAHESRIRPINLTEKPLLLKIFGLSFLLTWTEQSSVFQYLSNVTLGNQATLLETTTVNSDGQFILTHGSYLIGLTFGNIFFTLFFGFLLLQFINQVVKLSNLPYSLCVRNLNFGILTFTLALSISSIPYYGFDYLLTAPLGFVSQDDSLEKVRLKTNLPDTIGYLGQLSESKYLDTEVTPFDRGSYLRDFATPKSYESLNYQGEYFWNSRLDRSASVTQKYRSLEFNPKKDPEVELPSLRDTDKTSNKTNNEINDLDLYEGSLFESRNKQVLLNKLDKNFERNSNPSYANLLSEVLDYSFNESFFTTSASNAPQEVALQKIELNIKQKYYSNPLYKALLNLDIDSFISHQPVAQRLSAAQEKQLFENRFVLASYYDTLRDYRLLSYSTEFQNYFNGTKSYANRVYNQQFKGTLNVVRRLFAIDLETSKAKGNLSANSDAATQSVLKFDQPQFNQFKDSNLALYHEELLQTANDGRKTTPFLENTSPTPFYAGWDNAQRKFIVTNRLFARESAGNEVNLSQKNGVNFVPSRLSNTSKIKFTSWPLTEKGSKKLSLPFISVPQDKLTQVVSSLGLEDDGFGSATETLKLPPNIKKMFEVCQISIPDIFPPKRGGFLW
jgi:MFS family permease